MNINEMIGLAKKLNANELTILRNFIDEAMAKPIAPGEAKRKRIMQAAHLIHEVFGFDERAISKFDFSNDRFEVLHLSADAQKKQCGIAYAERFDIKYDAAYEQINVHLDHVYVLDEDCDDGNTILEKIHYMFFENPIPDSIDNMLDMKFPDESVYTALSDDEFEARIRNSIFNVENCDCEAILSSDGKARLFDLKHSLDKQRQMAEAITSTILKHRSEFMAEYHTYIEYLKKAKGQDTTIRTMLDCWVKKAIKLAEIKAE